MFPFRRKVHHIKGENLFTRPLFHLPFHNWNGLPPKSSLSLQLVGRSYSFYLIGCKKLFMLSLNPCLFCLYYAFPLHVIVWLPFLMTFFLPGSPLLSPHLLLSTTSFCPPLSAPHAYLLCIVVVTSLPFALWLGIARIFSLAPWISLPAWLPP